MYYLYNDKQHDKSEHLPTCHHHPHIAQWLFVSSFHLTKVGVSLRWHRKNTLKSITNIPDTPPSVIVQSHYFLFWTIMFRYFEMYYYVYWDYSTVSHFKIVVVFHVHFLSPFLIGLTTQESTFVFLGRDLQSETTQATKWQGYPLSSYQLICLNYQHWPNLVTVTSPCGYVWCVYDKKAGQLKFPNRFDGCVESSHQSHHLGVGRTRNWEIRPRKLNLRIEIVWHSKPLLLGI